MKEAGKPEVVWRHCKGSRGGVEVSLDLVYLGDILPEVLTLRLVVIQQLSVVQLAFR